MQILPAIGPESATGKTKELLDGVRATLGMIPNLMRTMANSPTVLETYLHFHGTLPMGSLPASLREQIALTVAGVSNYTHCLAAHAAVGKIVGLSNQEILDSRAGTSPIRRVEAVLQFARQVAATVIGSATKRSPVCTASDIAMGRSPKSRPTVRIADIPLGAVMSRISRGRRDVGKFVTTSEGTRALNLDVNVC